LSGGLDSASVAAVAAEQSAQLSLPAPRALSLAFPHPDCNEEILQGGIAAGLGLPLDLVPFGAAIGNRGFVEAALSQAARLSEPLQNVWLPAYVHLAARAAAAGCRVILTGSGGDEWLTVTPRYAADLLRQFDVAGVFQLWRSIRRSYSLPLLPALRNVLWTNGARPLLGAQAAKVLRVAAPQILRQRRLARLHRSAPDWLAPDPALRRELQRRAEERTEEDLLAPAMDWYWRDVRQVFDHPQTTMEMEEVFEYGRQLGLRILHPYWDADLVAFLYRMPPRLLNRDGRSKGLVRQSVARRFSNLGFERQKKVTSTRFFESQVLGSGTAAWCQLGDAVWLAQMGVVDGARLRADVERLLAQRCSRGVERIWSVMNLEAWLRPRVRGASYEER
jgi:asparagine synthase (glutamine-hydrolysing)